MATNEITGKWNAAISLANIESGQETVGGQKTDFLRYYKSKRNMNIFRIS